MHENEDDSSDCGLILFVMAIVGSPVMALLIGVLINYVIVKFSLVELVHARPVTFWESLIIYFFLLASPFIFLLVIFVVGVLQAFFEAVMNIVVSKKKQEKNKSENHRLDNIEYNGEVSIRVMGCVHCAQLLMPRTQHLCLSGQPNSSFIVPAIASKNTENYFLTCTTSDASDSKVMAYAIIFGKTEEVKTVDMRSNGDQWGQYYEQNWEEPFVTPARNVTGSR